MEPILSGFIIKLTADLTTAAMKTLGRKTLNKLSDPEKKRAIERCMQAGILAMIASMRVQDDEQLEHVKDVLQKKFTTDAVAMEVAELLNNEHLDRPALAQALQEEGFDPETLPELDIEQAVSALESGFLLAAAHEPVLQDILKIKLMLQGLDLQAQMRDSLEELVSIVRQGFRELCVQQGQLLAIGQNDEPHTIRLVFAGGGEPTYDTDWLRYYLKTLKKRCDTLDLTPIDETHPMGTAKNSDRDVHLSEVFVNLNLKNLSRLPEEDLAAVIRKEGGPELQAKEAQEGREPGKEEERIPVQAIEAIAAMPRLVVLGQPGGGKSTLANHLVVQLAARCLGEKTPAEKMPGWPAGEKHLPVLIILRRYAAWLEKQSRTDSGSGCIWDYLKEQMQQDGCGEAFIMLKSHLVREGGVVFFDGLDEIRESEDTALRSRIIETIKAFSGDNESCKIIITCREYSYKKDHDWRLPQQHFPVVELALFDDKQIAHFTRVWYRTIGPGKGWSTSQCDEEAEALYNAALGDPNLYELAQSPLLLTLMAQVHGRDGRLPEDRADLYERAVNLLLAHWENRIVRDVSGGRRVEPSLIMRLGIRSDILRTALENVAFHAHEKQQSAENRSARTADIDREDLRKELYSALKDHNKVEQVMQYAQERAGLLLARGTRTYTFPHRTFQEYLSACHIMRQENFDDMLADRIARDLPWWREVFLLAAGVVRKTPRNIADLADAVLEDELRPETASPAGSGRARLVARALIESDFRKNIAEKSSGRYSTTLQRCRNSLLATMLATDTLEPVERARSGATLARLGDPRDFVLEVDAMRFCLIPAGPFMMGSNRDDDKSMFDDEEPLHENTILQNDYWLARFPVTVAQFRDFMRESNYELDDEHWKKDPENHPVRYINWYDAMAFCRWLETRWQEKNWLPPGYQVSLPSEAEWEKAARGGLRIPEPVVERAIADINKTALQFSLQQNELPKRIYPWGQKIDKNRLNYDQTGIDTTSAVGCFSNGASPCGCEEMLGNVWEWTRSLDYGKFPYPYDPQTGCEDIKAGSDIPRVVRGGAFFDIRRLARCAARSKNYPHYRGRDIGFRVVLRLSLDSVNSEL